MLVINLRNREAFLRLQDAYIQALRLYMDSKGMKVLDELVDLTVEVDGKAQAFKIKEQGLGSRVSYKEVLFADKDYASDYDIFDYYCKYHKTNEIVLPSYLGYDTTGILGYFKTLEFSMNGGFKVEVDNYKVADAYLSNYIIPVCAKLDTTVSDYVNLKNVRAIGNLKSLCRAFPISFNIEAHRFGGTVRYGNKKRKLTRQQEEIRDSILQLLNNKFDSEVFLFNYIKANNLGGIYSNRLVCKGIEDKKGNQGCVVTFIDGGK